MMDNKILLTGITGNVGSAVVKYLKSIKIDFIAGVRDIERSKQQDDSIQYIHFDFQDTVTYETALHGVKKVFLVRPPQLTDVRGIFIPFIQKCKEVGVNQIVFLSLLGAEKNPFPPHHKIEKAIVESEIPYTFIRPSFFMQNLSTTHAEDIKERDDLFISSGKAKLSFIDTRDIGEIIGRTITEEGHKNKAYTITGSQAITYYKVADIMTRVLGRKITYSNPSLFKFRKDMIKRGIKKDFATIMVILYLTTKLGMANHVTNTAELLLKRKPRTIEDFIKDYIDIWQ
ncbi:SDR family oxidoreductase [Clostridium estertheticum]|uniref:SDR family oxidoreductase n=1 Tax=Clostridium estertheticum TaxID=238834 RepID=UPI001CF596DD|nr:SDR family oxidoreductase [Clostridium estertheticum]MCB2339037.1 SDR family oxidoreductase [Clostridium estertheticum]